MHSTITQTELDTIAADLDRAARERAHGMSPSSDGPTAFACDYVRAMAETCGALAADQCATGEEWDPADWLSEDSRAVTQAAELVGVERRRQRVTPSRLPTRAMRCSRLKACGL